MRAQFLSLLNSARQCPDLCFSATTSRIRPCQSYFINYTSVRRRNIASAREVVICAPPSLRLAQNEESSIVIARREIHQGDISTKMFCFFRSGLRQKSHFTFPRNSPLSYIELLELSWRLDTRLDSRRRFRFRIAPNWTRVFFHVAASVTQNRDSSFSAQISRVISTTCRNPRTWRTRSSCHSYDVEGSET